jgi:hypothetical protein
MVRGLRDTGACTRILHAATGFGCCFGWYGDYEQEGLSAEAAAIIRVLRLHFKGAVKWQVPKRALDSDAVFTPFIEVSARSGLGQCVEIGFDSDGNDHRL